MWRWTTATQLHMGEGKLDMDRSSTWATYVSYAVFLALPLCCWACCTLCLPSPTPDARLAKLHRRDIETPPRDSASVNAMAVGEHALPDGTRRRASAPASSDSSDGSTPLLPETPQAEDGVQPSPHLL